MGPLRSTQGYQFTVKVPKGYKPGEQFMAVVDKSKNQPGDVQEAKGLLKGQILEYVTVPRGKKEGDFLGAQLTPTNKEFFAYVPKGAGPGAQLPYLVLDTPPEGCAGCFQKICGFYE